MQRFPSVVVLQFALVWLLAFASPTAGAQEARAASALLAPAGKLRVISFANGVLYATSGAPQGIAQDVGAFLAGRLGVPMEAVVLPNADAYGTALAGADWDVAIGPRTAALGERLDFGPDVALVDNVYVAAPGREFDSPAAVDRAGVRVAAARNSPPEQIIRRELKNAQLVQTAGGVASAVEILRSGGADVYATNGAAAFEIAAAIPGSRIVGAFATVRLAVGLRKDAAPVAKTSLSALVSEANDLGIVRQTIESLALKGVRPSAAR